jgi:quercetin dioxygenase-like cupin family protein
MRESESRYPDLVLGREMRAVILTRGAETDGRHDLTEAVQEPGTVTPLHLHTRYYERIWVVDGEITVWVGDDTYNLGPGGFVTIPMNTPHMVQARPRGARALNVSSPAGFAELVERTATPSDRAGSDPKLDLERFMAVSTELGDVVLGPPGTTADQLPPGRLARLDALHERRPLG